MNDKRPLWPEQYANRKVQEHEEQIAALLGRVEALEKREAKPARKKQAVQVKGAKLAVKG